MSKKTSQQVIEELQVEIEKLNNQLKHAWIQIHCRDKLLQEAKAKLDKWMPDTSKRKKGKEFVRGYYRSSKNKNIGDLEYSIDSPIKLTEQ